jgi:hypothetical protein
MDYQSKDLAFIIIIIIIVYLADCKQEKTQKILLQTRETEIWSDIYEFFKKNCASFCGFKRNCVKAIDT